jgi:hypothetical protein
MDIRIIRIGTRLPSENGSVVVNTYRVTEDGREFLLERTSHAHGKSLSLAGRKGILYVDADDNKVHNQMVTPGGACGLITDDEVVEGLSLWALRGVITADRRNEPREVSLTGDDASAEPRVCIGGEVVTGFF